MASLFEDTFVCKDVDMALKDPKNPSKGKVRDKKFDRVSRITAESEHHHVSLTLDVHSQLYPLRTGDRFIFALMSSIRLDGLPGDGTFDQSGEPSLADRYDYVMCGKVFQHSPQGTTSVTLFASFGGLLMSLQGGQKAIRLFEFPIDSRIYLLMRNV